MRTSDDDFQAKVSDYPEAESLTTAIELQCWKDLAADDLSRTQRSHDRQNMLLTALLAAVPIGLAALAISMILGVTSLTKNADEIRVILDDLWRTASKWVLALGAGIMFGPALLYWAAQPLDSWHNLYYLSPFATRQRERKLQKLIRSYKLRIATLEQAPTNDAAQQHTRPLSPGDPAIPPAPRPVSMAPATPNGDIPAFSPRPTGSTTKNRSATAQAEPPSQ